MLLNDKYAYNPKTDLLGAGGFGRVYKARDTLLDRDVALKMVNIEGAKAQYSLVEEIKKAISLHHNNIVRYYDVFTLKGESFTGEEIETQVGVMEYIPHGDISQLHWSSLSPGQQKDILLQIVDVLHYLHQHKIIHRDIKPSNILIKKEADRIIPKITDFGISKAQDSASVSVSRVIGSIPYMAPEQFDSKGRVSFNTDFWSLGILVYRLFTGTLPFGDESTTSEGVIMKNIMQMPVPSEVIKIPQPFRSLVELCLVKDRGSRISDARALIQTLSNAEKKKEEVFADKEEKMYPASDSKVELVFAQSKEDNTNTQILNEQAEQKTILNVSEKDGLSKEFEETIIGNQTWMSKNLNANCFQNGDKIPVVTTVKEWIEAGRNHQPALCSYEFDHSNEEENGKLYNWFAVNDHRGLAPPGWKIPTTKDWVRLSKFLGGESVAGSKIFGKDKLGFNALPSGYCDKKGKFFLFGTGGHWWSMTSRSETQAYYVYIIKFLKELNYSEINKRCGLSVRCIKL